MDEYTVRLTPQERLSFETLKEHHKEHHAKLDEWDAELRRLQAERDELRAALEAVEWVYEYRMICAWCGESYDYGHAPDCQRQRALRAGQQAESGVGE
jgi:hypothetical protein